MSKEDRIDLAVAQEIEITKDLTLGYVPKERLWTANQMTSELKKKALSRNTNDIQWTDRGPTNVGGRTRALIQDSRDSLGLTFIAGSVAGGIWKGENIFTHAAIWTDLTPDLSNLAIGSLVQDPNHPDVLYAGTGEGWFNGDAVRGVGILKSEDGGNTWNLLPSTRNSNFYYTQKLVIDHNGHLLACTRNNGLVRSNDGGLSWDKLLGSGVGAFSERAADIELGADHSLYASLGIFSFDGVYRSDDNGATWHYLHQNGLPTDDFRRIEIATAPSDANVLYAILENQDGSCLGIYRSRDKGEIWMSLPIPTSSSGLRFGRNQIWYDVTLAVDPEDADHVIIGAVNLFHSRNGGNSWQQLSNWFGTDPPFVHADQHFVLFDKKNSDHVVFANDGGIFTTKAILDNNPTFTHQVRNYNVTQFYSCAIHPFERGVIAGGAQDNGTHALLDPSSSVSLKISGGDGGHTHFAGDHGQYLISSFTNNSYRFYEDFGFIGSARFSGGSFTNPTTVMGDYFYGNNGSGEFFRIHLLDGSFSEEIISVDAFEGSTIRHISPSPSQPDRLYFGLSNGKVVYVDNVNIGNQPVGVEILDRGGNISCVAVDPTNEDHVVVTISNYGEISVWETRDGGLIWQNSESNLPDVPVRWAVFGPGRSQIVLLATEVGVWRTDSINGAWTSWLPDPNFPNARTDMIKIQESTGHVVAGTHGRGFFTTDYFEQFVGTADEKRTKPRLSVYPNPTSDYIIIQHHNEILDQVQLLTLNGKQIATFNNSERKIDVSQLVPGTYLLSITHDKFNSTIPFIKL